jgi:haloacetate dehalogenase
LFFDGFLLPDRRLRRGRVVRVRHGGDGPPVVLLHGHPRTHATWHRVAALLADRHTVVCPDLRGYGASTAAARRPPTTRRRPSARWRATSSR